MVWIAGGTTSSTSVIDFSSIPQTFTHFQARVFVRSQVNAVDDFFGFYFNNSTTASTYYIHSLYGDGASAFSNGTSNNQMSMFSNRIPAATSTANIFSVFIVDILDYTNTNKNKVFRSIGGKDMNGSGIVGVNSGVWLSTAAINQITFDISANFAAGSRIDLYGITSSQVTGA